MPSGASLALNPGGNGGGGAVRKKPNGAVAPREALLTGARDPRLARKALKSRLNPNFSTTEQFASLALVCSRAAQMPNACSAAKLGTFTCMTNAPAAIIAASAWSITARVAAFDVA